MVLLFDQLFVSDQLLPLCLVHMPSEKQLALPELEQCVFVQLQLKVNTQPQTKASYFAKFHCWLAWFYRQLQGLSFSEPHCVSGIPFLLTSLQQLGVLHSSCVSVHKHSIISCKYNACPALSGFKKSDAKDPYLPSAKDLQPLATLSNETFHK